MFAPLAMGLSIAFMAVCLTLSSNEEIIKVTAAIVASIALLACLCFAPLFVKIPLVAIVLTSNKFNLGKFFTTS